jgi:hypothetical protein
MAEASLIFDEDSLDRGSVLYGLYNKFYEGTINANEVELPDFTENPPLDGDGEVDVAAIEAKAKEYSSIQMKNSAYRMASAIMSAFNGDEESGSGGSSGLNFVLRTGDAMSGELRALYGFKAGRGDTVIFETVLEDGENPVAHVSGRLDVDGDIRVTGSLSTGTSGIIISGTNALYFADGCLNMASENIKITGSVEVAGTFKLGEVSISDAGVFWQENEFYHSGNSNKEDVDWSMRDGHIYGMLRVDENATFHQLLSATGGFILGAEGNSLFYSDKTADGKDFIQLSADLSLSHSYGIQFDGKNVLKVRGSSNNIISLSAPGMTLNLGDSDNGTATQAISLQAGIYNYSKDYEIISPYGDGNFPNSLRAGCGNASPSVLQTYYESVDDCGVVFARRVRLGSSSGPALYAPDIEQMAVEVSYLHVDNNVQHTDYIRSSMRYRQTSSLFKDLSLPWSASLHFDTDAEFFTFNKPVEAKNFSIISEHYKTRLLENSLFFGDGIFLEGVTDGILHSGNASFTGDLSSQRFAGGFAGYGWSIGSNRTYGNVAATFDELTIRKKMRVYELEVQKSTVTNGSLWVSDSCSGDLVEEIN